MDRFRQQNIQVPDKDPLTPVEAAKALNVDVEEIYSAIQTGRLSATDIAGAGATVRSYRIPLKNFVFYVNQTFSKELFFKFPAEDPLTIPRVARALRCSDTHIYNLIDDCEFPNSFDLSRKNSYRRNSRIPLRDLVDFIKRRREGAF